MRKALAEKRAKQAIVDKEEAKRNEVRERFPHPGPAGFPLTLYASKFARRPPRKRKT